MFRAMWLNIPGLIFVVGLCCLDGLVIFAVYADCDLKKSKKVTSNDQVYTYSPIRNNVTYFSPCSVSFVLIGEYIQYSPLINFRLIIPSNIHLQLIIPSNIHLQLIIPSNIHLQCLCSTKK